MKILVFAGDKQAGKSSAANFLYGLILASKGVIKDFYLDDVGDVAFRIDDDTAIKFDRNAETDFARQIVWPHVKHFSLAEPLKRQCMLLFGLTYEQCYGTNEQKNSLSQIRYGDVSNMLSSESKPDILPKRSDFLTARQLLQYVGDINRQINKDCYAHACQKRILSDQPDLAIVDDCRFINELQVFKDMEATIIKLVGNRCQDSHKSETELQSVPNSQFNAVISTSNKTIHQKNDAIVDYLIGVGWLHQSPL